ncbi:MAG: hypothetical protein J7J77_00375 [Candidatus Cloacimonetes bacterium]|nr:hypothetical protein [Candidatus Cloacimonadota bacterium]
MGLFDRKPRISAQEWCEYFYNNYVFSPNIGQANPWQLFCDAAYQQILKSDSTFSVVDVSDFSEQLLALRLEVIGIVWLFHVKDDLAPKQSECTRLYLLKHNREGLWDMMEPYNRAVAKSIVGGNDSNTRMGRAHIVFMNSMRTQLFDKWTTVISDPKDAARPANRVGSNVPWKSHKTQAYLSFALTDQLQCEVNEKARKGMMAIIQGFFNGASEELRKVKIIS